MIQRTQPLKDKFLSAFINNRHGESVHEARRGGPSESCRWRVPQEIRGSLESFPLPFPEKVFIR
jgi:hypothetical protein